MKYRYYKRVLKDIGPIILNNIGYIPTALHVWHTLKNAKMMPVPDYESSFCVEGKPHLKHKERKDIIGRANWLLKEVLVKDPEQLIRKMPEIIGRQFQGEWAIYACSMTAFALCNIIKLFTDTKVK